MTLHISQPSATMERLCVQRGARFVIGVDEVGRGALAGEVFAGAVAFLPDAFLWWERQGLNDSKVLSEEKRENLSAILRREDTVYCGLGSVDHETIDSIGIVQATLEAMRKAVCELMKALPGTEMSTHDLHILVDGQKTIPRISTIQAAIEKADALSISCAAASILAKVERDNQMKCLASRYPGYGFERNKGYGTKEHRQAVALYGACSIHRRSFLS